VPYITNVAKTTAKKTTKKTTKKPYFEDFISVLQR
jgi:hypothetical protein